MAVNVSVEHAAPGTKLVAVTPNDSTDLGVVRALYVGAGGNVAVVAIHDSSAVTLVGVPTGTIIPVMVSKVMATNTTATSIVAIY